jgi:hypothetical protein
MPEPFPSGDELMVSLFEAASRAYHKVTGSHTVDHGALNKIARLIAKETKVFTRISESEEYHLVIPGEIEEGEFKLGGAYVEFHDGRPSLSNLRILRREMPDVIESLRETTMSLLLDQGKN